MGSHLRVFQRLMSLAQNSADLTGFTEALIDSISVHGVYG